ncbi:MAG: serine/threonine-protein phosphatase [Chloroflexi bacterium]|nr:serine/threonine-protein phosphatase [Chloroflexota bacterium]
MEIQAAVAKVHKYATSESGDTLEIIERPHGGLSLVLADGQRSGRAAKAISNLVARKAISLLAEGVRDGAAARAAHDYLYANRGGKVSATLNIVSVDLVTRTLVISRNSHCPVIIADQHGTWALNEPSQPIGIYPGTKPVITELPIAPHTWLVVFTDGVLAAGQRYGERLDMVQLVSDFLAGGERAAQAMADDILERAVELDRGRPSDDISVLVIAIVPRLREDSVRRMTVSFPIDKLAEK